MARRGESTQTYESYHAGHFRPTLSFMRRCERLARREKLLAALIDPWTVLISGNTLGKSSAPMPFIEMTPQQAEEQRRSFAYGNAALSNPAVTREMVDEIADKELRLADFWPILKAMEEHGSQRAAAKALGMNLSTFQRRLKKAQCAV